MGAKIPLTAEFMDTSMATIFPPNFMLYTERAAFLKHLIEAATLMRFLRSKCSKMLIKQSSFKSVIAIECCSRLLVSNWSLSLNAWVFSIESIRKLSVLQNIIKSTNGIEITLKQPVQGNLATRTITYDFEQWKIRCTQTHQVPSAKLYITAYWDSWWAHDKNRIPQICLISVRYFANLTTDIDFDTDPRVHLWPPLATPLSESMKPVVMEDNSLRMARRASPLVFETNSRSHFPLGLKMIGMEV